MKNREIVIRLQLPRAPRKRWLVGGGALVMLLGAIAYAAVTWPSSHPAGTKLSGTDIDGYLNDLNTRVSAQSPMVPTWNALTLQNGWTAYGTPYNAPGYTKTPDGMVRLRGLIKGGTATAGTTIATGLPTGFQPAAVYDFAVSATGGTAAIDVLPAGNLTLDATPVGNSYLSLDGIAYFSDK